MQLQPEAPPGRVGCLQHGTPFLAPLLVHAAREFPELGQGVDQRLSLLELHLKGLGASVSAGEDQLDPFSQRHLILTELAQLPRVNAAVTECLRSRIAGYQQNDLTDPLVGLLPNRLLATRLEQPLDHLSDFHSLPPPRLGRDALPCLSEAARRVCRLITGYL